MDANSEPSDGYSARACAERPTPGAALPQVPPSLRGAVEREHAVLVARVRELETALRPFADNYLANRERLEALAADPLGARAVADFRHAADVLAAGGGEGQT